MLQKRHGDQPNNSKRIFLFFSLSFPLFSVSHLFCISCFHRCVRVRAGGAGCPLLVLRAAPLAAAGRTSRCARKAPLRPAGARVLQRTERHPHPGSTRCTCPRVGTLGALFSLFLVPEFAQACRFRSHEILFDGCVVAGCVRCAWETAKRPARLRGALVFPPRLAPRSLVLPPPVYGVARTGLNEETLANVNSPFLRRCGRCCVRADAFPSPPLPLRAGPAPLLCRACAPATIELLSCRVAELQSAPEPRRLSAATRCSLPLHLPSPPSPASCLLPPSAPLCSPRLPAARTEINADTHTPLSQSSPPTPPHPHTPATPVSLPPPLPAPWLTAIARLS